MIIRDLHPRLEEDEVGRFRCIKCGTVIDEIDPERLRREPCGMPYIRKPHREGGSPARHSRD